MRGERSVTAVERDVSKAERLAELHAGIEAQHTAAAEKQATRGKRGARERVLKLLDEGSFQEIDPFVQHRATLFGIDRAHPYGDGVVIGFGTIDGRTVGVFSQDFT
ncbi:MAG: methylmalonyl-CoA carboxyltransferase, partial [Thermomicrobiales bacterium]|nr:methylmalonyl-CoA carboxyltransferase [Thermomicrobiales bacterium]